MSRTLTRRAGIIVAAFTFAGMLSPEALAQGFPNRPLRLIYPLAPGSGPDVVGRKIAAEAAKLLGQPIVFENRPGANGRLGLQPMKEAPADGHMLNLLPDGVLMSQPAQDPGFKLEAGKDYAPVSILFGSPFVLIARPGMPFRDLKGLVAYAKANPSKLNFAVTAGATSQFLAERFVRALDIDVTMVAFKGGAETGTATLGGHTDMFFSTTAMKPTVDSGKLVAVASSGKERWKPFVGTPTFTEAGLPLVYNGTYVLVAGAGTPRETVMALHKAFNGGTRSPDVVKHMEDAGWMPFSGMSPEEVASFIQSEIKVWIPILRKPGA